MTYHGVVLLLAGYQADEQHILQQYRAIVDKCVLSTYIATPCSHPNELVITGSQPDIQMGRCGS